MKLSQDSILERERDYWEARAEFEWLSENGIQLILNIIKPIKGDVLELCSGSGMFTKRIRDLYDSYTCLDLSQSLLEKLHQELPKIVPVHGNAEAPDFPPSSFDMILVFAGLHHIPDEEKAVRNAYRLLRPGGTFAAFEPNGKCWYRKPMLSMKRILNLYTEDERFLDPTAVRRMMDQVGFKNIQFTYRTPGYNPAHLRTLVNKMLSQMMITASSMVKASSWQSFFVVKGEK